MQDATGRLALPIDQIREAGKAGELDAEFEARLADSSTLAYRVAFSVVRHRQDAEDVTQEAFARAYGRFDQLRDRDRFRAWLIRMTWRLAIDHFRQHRRRQTREAAASPAVASADPSQEAEVLATERHAALWRAIERLPEAQRVTIVLSAIDGHGVREVASLLGLPEGTVKWRLFDARRRLQEMLS